MKIIRKFIILFFLFSCFKNYALNLGKSASVISSAGDSYVSDSLQIDWSIGESVIFTSESNTDIVSQGFQQPMVCKVLPTLIVTNQTACDLPLNLIVSNYFNYFQWQLGNRVIANHSSFTFSPVSNGLHRVTVGDSLGCLLTSKAVDIDMTIKKSIPTIDLIKSENFDTLLVASDASSYQWYLHDIISNNSQIIVDATNRTYKPDVSGTYFIKTNKDNFCVANSIMYVVKVSENTNLDNNELTANSTFNLNNESKFKVFPNPCHNNYFVEYYSPQKKLITIEMTDINGKVIIAYQCASNQVKTIAQFNCDNLTRGTYLLKIAAENNTIVKKLIIE